MLAAVVAPDVGVLKGKQVLGYEPRLLITCNIQIDLGKQGQAQKSD